MTRAQSYVVIFLLALLVISTNVFGLIGIVNAHRIEQRLPFPTTTQARR